MDKTREPFSMRDIMQNVVLRIDGRPDNIECQITGSSFGAAVAFSILGYHLSKATGIDITDIEAAVAASPALCAGIGSATVDLSNLPDDIAARLEGSTKGGE